MSEEGTRSPEVTDGVILHNATLNLGIPKSERLPLLAQKLPFSLQSVRMEIFHSPTLRFIMSHCRDLAGLALNL